MDTDNLDDLQTEIRIHKRRLRLLKQQAAMKGSSADPSIQIEIEDIEKKLKRLQPDISFAGSSSIPTRNRLSPALQKKQHEALQRSLSLVFRLRDTIRELSKLVEDTSGYDQVFGKFERFHSELENLAYDNRALLPRDIFEIIHDARAHLALVKNSHLLYRKISQFEQNLDIASFKDLSGSDFTKMDSLYKELVQLVQARLGIDLD